MLRTNPDTTDLIAPQQSTNDLRPDALTAPFPSDALATSRSDTGDPHILAAAGN